MPQLCVTAYGCLEGIWLPTLEHCCLSSTAYIDDSHYLDIISNNAVIINVHLCSHSEHDNMAPIIDNVIDGEASQMGKRATNLYSIYGNLSTRRYNDTIVF
jgi:hypothetical protein